MTTPSIRSTNTSAEAVAVTSHDVSYPATISAGDLLLVLMSVNNGSTEMEFPSAWMPINFCGRGISLHAAVTIATGSETGTFAVTSNASVVSVHAMYSVYDWSGDIGDISWVGLPAASATTKNPPEILTGLASHDWLFVAGMGIDSSISVTVWPTNYSTSQIQQTGSLSVALAARAVTGATSDDPGTFTHGGSADDGGVFGIAIPGPSPTNPYPKIKAQRFDQETTDTTGPVVNMPADIDSGDLILVALAADGAPAVSVPGTLGTFTLINESANGTATKVFVYGKVAAGTEGGGSMTLTTDSQQFQIGVWVIKNWSGSLSDIESAISDGSSVSPDPGSITPSWGADDTLWAVFGAVDANGGVVTAWPTGFHSQTNMQSGNATGCALFAAFHRENTTTVDPSALTIDPTDNWATVHLAIKQSSSEQTYTATHGTINAVGFEGRIERPFYATSLLGTANAQGFAAQEIADAFPSRGIVNFGTSVPQTHVTRTFFGLLGQLRALGFEISQQNFQTFFANAGFFYAQGSTATVTTVSPPSTFTANALLGTLNFQGFQAQTIRDFFPITAASHAVGFTPNYVEFINEISGPDGGQVNFSGFAAQAIVLGQIRDIIAQGGTANFVAFQHAVDMWRTLDILQGRANFQGFAPGIAIFQGGAVSVSSLPSEVNFEAISQAVSMYRTFHPESGLTNFEGFVPTPSTGTLVQSIVGILNHQGFVPFIVSERYRGIVGEASFSGYAPTIGGGLWTPKRRKATSWAAIN